MKCTNHPHTLDKICLSDSSSSCAWCGCAKQSEPEIWVTFQGHLSWFKNVQAYPAETKCPCTHTTYDYAWCMNISQPLNHWLKKPRTYIYIYTNTHVCIDHFAYSSPHLGSTLGEKRNTPASGNDNSWCFRLVVKPPTVGRGKGMSPWRYARQNTSTKLDQRDKPWTDKPRTITHKERSKWRVSSLKSWEIYTINTQHNCY